MKFKKRKRYNINTNAGDIETSTAIFNNSVSTDACGLGEDINSYDTLAEKERVFNEIKKINPNADRKSYTKKSVRQMLAILNSYKERQKGLTKKPHTPIYKKHNDVHDFSDIYFDEESGDYMIKGLQIGFDTEQEAEEYIKELNSNEE